MYEIKVPKLFSIFLIVSRHTIQKIPENTSNLFLKNNLFIKQITIFIWIFAKHDFKLETIFCSKENNHF